ncbi:MAG TPA: nucleoside-diphosphate sugar epimerase/dehydratase [Armatimonadota bacterium]|jgi:FlaA1/EpsC-like NDP-sugar epimerase
MDQLAKRVYSSRPIIARLILMAADFIALIAALTCAFLLRFDTVSVSAIFAQYIQPHLVSTISGLLVFLVLLTALNMYRHAWRFASVEIIWSLMVANAIGVLLLVPIQLLLDRSIFPRAVFVIFWLLSVMLTGGMRVFLRLANLLRSNRHALVRALWRNPTSTRVVILGGGADGARLLHALHEEMANPYRVIGFLDDQPGRQGIFIRGVRVLGPLRHLYTLLATHAVDEVLIALPDASGEQIRDYVLACRRQRIVVKVIPGLAEVLRGTARARLEEISVEDLLRRAPVQINIDEIGGYLKGKRVLVTGAGGSIGSELCRQIFAQDPAMLILLGHGENSIHQIHQELSIRFPLLADRLHMVISSVADESRIMHTFGRLRPQVVFHAAAHKHVPIMEANVTEAVHNNVFGTRCVARASGQYHVERMVLISTDKAVYPSSVMGATKWLCEEVVRAQASTYPATNFVTVRFGNVLGSRGSVIPIFKEQIRRGGPVTITHPEMTRYFMTIPEAVQLVLQAGAVGQSPDLYLLDMGQPVKIADLAHDMIRLCGLEPNKDIAITVTGLRPGEKLHELLSVTDERLTPASCAGFSSVERPCYFTTQQFHEVTLRLLDGVAHNDDEALLTCMRELIPGFAEWGRAQDRPTVLTTLATAEPCVEALRPAHLVL